jgi:hypothetical protein
MVAGSVLRKVGCMKKMRMVAAVSVCVGVAVMMAGCGKKPAAAKTPDKAVMNAVKALQKDKPQELFTALPASYQKDINSVVADAAKKMDEEVWNAGQDLLKQVVKIAKTKKKLILQSSMLASNPNKDEVEKNWDQGIDMLSTLINSDFTNLKKLRKGDVAAILANSGSTIMKKAKKLKTEASEEIEKLNTVKATLVSQDGDKAKVKIEAKDEEPETVDFVRVEGQWIPADMAEGFTEGIESARENIAKIDFTSEEGKKLKSQILTQISAIKTSLKQVESAKTKEDLDGAMMGIIMSFMASGMMGGGQSAPPPPASM